MRARLLCIGAVLICMAMASRASSSAAELPAARSKASRSPSLESNGILSVRRDNRPTDSQEDEPRLFFQTLRDLLDREETEEALPDAARPSRIVPSDRARPAARDAPILRTALETETEVRATDEAMAATYAESEPTLPAPPEPQGRALAAPRKAQGDNSALIDSGRDAFSRDCTSCHDTQRALSKRKSLGAWRTTIRRMASKAGADIPSSDFEAIAAYLAAETNPTSAADADAANAAAPSTSEKQTEESSVSAFGVLSPLWRGGRTDSLQNPGFFPELWVGAAWQPQGALSARATACISCHNEIVSRVEVVEAAMRLDLSKWFDCPNPKVQATIDAGRFIVPFGAFSAQVSPGAFRTVTPPLIFNMGQRVANSGIAVLPMPYSDEGTNFHAAVPLDEEMDVTFDGYLVNGLQGSNFGINFLQSRDYVDNNSQPAGGGRVTLGNHYIRGGASITGGRFNVPLAGVTPGLDYQIFGFDVAAHYEDIVRVQAEFARRDMDTFSGSFASPQPLANDRTTGYYIEGELRICQKPRVSVLARYDSQDRGTNLGDARHVRRLTAGMNFSLPGGSLLMVNYERWWLSDPFPDVDVVGIRWAATF